MESNIEAYPSHHLDAMRGLSDVSFVLLDEADFFPPGQQQDARCIREVHCEIKSLVNNGINTKCARWFVRKNKEPEEICLYKRLLLDYTYGLDRIYTREEIEMANRKCFSY
jgi:hypothetical protein